MKYTYEQKIAILKFLAQYPFEPMDFGKCCNNDYYKIKSQIIKIDYARQEITLKDYCEYTVEEITDTNGFCDKQINKKWVAFLSAL